MGVILEGVRIQDNGDFIFDFSSDLKTDLMSLQLKSKPIVRKQTNGIISFYSYRLNPKLDRVDKMKLLLYIKKKAIKSNEYDILLNNAIEGLFSNTVLDIKNIDVILLPESSSSLNVDIAKKINKKLSKATLISNAIIKNTLTDITLDYASMKDKKLNDKSIKSLEKTLGNASEDGSFKLKKIPQMFRKFVINFLKLNITDKKLINLLTDKNILVVDDFISGGNTFNEINKLIDQYSPKNIIFYTLIA